MSGERVPTDVTRLLEAVRAGDREALNQLYARVYAELRVLARRQRRRWQDTGTLNTTALVHEAYLKLVNQRGLDPRRQSISLQLLRPRSGTSSAIMRATGGPG